MNESKGPKEMIQEGLIYDCSIDELGVFQVQVLNRTDTVEVFVRVVRCTWKQKEILKKLNYRFHVPSEFLIRKSSEFSYITKIFTQKY